MWVVITLVFAQYGLTVQVIDARAGATYKTSQACTKAASRLGGAVPVSEGYVAPWEMAICHKITL